MSARLVSTSVVNVNKRSIVYELEIDRAISSTPSATVDIVYSNGNKERQAGRFALSNVSVSLSNGSSWVKGEVVLPERLDELMSFSVSTRITANNLTVTFVDPDTEETVEATVDNVDTIAEPIMPPTMENMPMLTLSDIADSELIAVVGNKYVFDGPVYKNLLEFDYDVPEIVEPEPIPKPAPEEEEEEEDKYESEGKDDPDSDDPDSGDDDEDDPKDEEEDPDDPEVEVPEVEEPAWRMREEERMGDLRVVRSRLIMANPCRLIITPSYTPAVVYRITADIADAIRVEASEAVLHNLELMGFVHSSNVGGLRWRRPYEYTSPDSWVAGSTGLDRPTLEVTQEVFDGFIYYGTVARTERYDTFYDLSDTPGDGDEDLPFFFVDPDDRG